MTAFRDPERVDEVSLPYQMVSKTRVSVFRENIMRTNNHKAALNESYRVRPPSYCTVRKIVSIKELLKFNYPFGSY